jgi:uncharacterized membrane protein (DUF106 family)
MINQKIDINGLSNLTRAVENLKDPFKRMSENSKHRELIILQKKQIEIQSKQTNIQEKQSEIIKKQTKFTQTLTIATVVLAIGAFLQICVQLINIPQLLMKT